MRRIAGTAKGHPALKVIVPRWRDLSPERDRFPDFMGKEQGISVSLVPTTCFHSGPGPRDPQPHFLDEESEAEPATRRIQAVFLAYARLCRGHERLPSCPASSSPFSL